jgi:hypothetical protein
VHIFIVEEREEHSMGPCCPAALSGCCCCCLVTGAKMGSTAISSSAGWRGVCSGYAGCAEIRSC